MTHEANKKLDSLSRFFVGAFITVLFVTLLVSMSGCNTVAGIARDFQAISEGTHDMLIKQRNKNESSN